MNPFRTLSLRDTGAPACMAAALLALGGAAAARAQSTGSSTPCGLDPAPVAESDRLPEFAVRQLAPSNVRELRSALRNECWTRALGTFYSVFRPDLPDWIVYIDSSGVIHQTFIHGRDSDSTSRVLHGERYIWASIFSDRPMHDVLTPDEDRALRADLAGSPTPRPFAPDAPIARVCSTAGGAATGVGGGPAAAAVVVAAELGLPTRRRAREQQYSRRIRRIFDSPAG